MLVLTSGVLYTASVLEHSQFGEERQHTSETKSRGVVDVEGREMIIDLE